VIAQIYTAQSVDEAVALADLGVDHVGVTISSRGLPGEVSSSVGREIVAATRSSQARSVALTVETELEIVREFVASIQPDIVHLCGDLSIVGPGAVGDLRAWIHRSELAVEVMQAIPMTGIESVEMALEFEPHVDWLILDSVTDSIDGIGAAGVTHDWSLSRQIVESVGVPVILAGGLGPDNVAEAIRVVQPAGVDSLTRTNRFKGDGSFTKDLEAVERFVDTARSVDK
jgi:phosphoribosylanthranilate isomerase